MRNCLAADPALSNKRGGGVRPPSWLVIFAAWTAAGTVSAIETYTYCNQFKGLKYPLWSCFWAAIPPWYAWALATPAILRLVDRDGLRHLRAATLLRHLALFGVTALAFSTLHSLLDVWSHLAMGDYPMTERIERTFVGWIS
ncbi:MAG TPA: hypothetical protein VNO21_08760, partial [Polyangiaceae bacterium]|nr:hypothetical protein [Polyangiaceae bacterium]